MFVPVDPLYVRVLNRIALIPVVLGLSFEVLQLTKALDAQYDALYSSGKDVLTKKLRDVPVLKFLGLPGLWLQYLTTKQPDDEQVDVAIHSFNHLLGSDKK